ARRQAAAQCQGGSGLAHAAFLVGDRPHAHQSDPPVVRSATAPWDAVPAGTPPSAARSGTRALAATFPIGSAALLLTAAPSPTSAPPSPTAPGAASTISTTRRLRLRPSSVRLSARGRCSP